MDAGQALAELTEISSQIEFALIFDARGDMIEATPADRQRAEALAFGATALLACTTQAGGPERGEPVQVELAYPEGSILLLREGGLRILALTSPDPIAGLAFFELRACLRKLSEVKQPKRWRAIPQAILSAVKQGDANESEARGDSPEPQEGRR